MVERPFVLDGPAADAAVALSGGARRREVLADDVVRALAGGRRFVRLDLTTRAEAAGGWRDDRGAVVDQPGDYFPGVSA